VRGGEAWALGGKGGRGNLAACAEMCMGWPNFASAGGRHGEGPALAQQPHLQ
jgi:hypothetical protein